MHAEIFFNRAGHAEVADICSYSLMIRSGQEGRQTHPVLVLFLVLIVAGTVFLKPCPAHSGQDHEFLSAPINISEPLPGTIYPLNMASPLFVWEDRSQSSDWIISINTEEQTILQVRRNSPWWIPDRDTWENLKKTAEHDRFEAVISGIDGTDGRTIISRGGTYFEFSRHKLDAVLMFMQKPLPFLRAMEKPEKTNLLAGVLDSYDPPRIIMSKPPVCANCHAYSARGDHLTIDTDFGGDKGGFLFSPMKERIAVDHESVFSWNELKPDFPATYSMGLFARPSPDGRYVAGTVSETSVFVMIDNLYFSQLFFPATGRIAVFDSHENKFNPLPGADRPDMVQTGPAWSPDGEELAFSAAPVDPGLISMVLNKTVRNESPDQSISELNKKYPVQFDIYTLPFNQGKGGPARPLEGASRNGYSNYFPRYSPDGKWIVFTRSPTGLVLQPGSELCIVPAKGGTARYLKSNMPIMNSWHSWSPDSRWLAFTSKANSPFTEIYLTHINQDGEASPAIRLFRFSSSELAAMVPEFIPGRADVPEKIFYGSGAEGQSTATDGR